MVNLLRIILINFFIITFMSCGSLSLFSNNKSQSDKIKLNYDQGIEFYNNKKYSKAKDSFEYVILHSTGSKLALESEFYLSESLYNLKEYEQALYGYDNYARSSQDLALIELSRFRLCECAYNLTVDYMKDQNTTFDAIEKIEIFLEDYPDSKYYTDILSLKLELRYRLAKKEYESAALYMKLGEYNAALIYLFDVLNNYAVLVESSDLLLIKDEYSKSLEDLLDNKRIFFYGFINAIDQNKMKHIKELETIIINSIF